MKASEICILLAALVLGLRKLYQALLPKPIKGLPHYADSTKRISGDLPRIKAEYEVSKEVSTTRYAHCRTLRSPIIQLFLDPISKPRVFLDDPRETEDILLRRSNEFDRSMIPRKTIGVIMPHCTISKGTSPEWRNQRRLWMDTMAPDFLRQVLAPRIHKSALELVELWRLKAQNVGDKAIDISHDFEAAALDAIWSAILGEDLGGIQGKISGLQTGALQLHKEGIDMVGTMRILDETIYSLSFSWFPWLDNWLLRRSSKFRSYDEMRSNEIDRLIRAAVVRFEKLFAEDLGITSSDGYTHGGLEHDTCAMDLVLRRRVLRARKTGIRMPDPTKDQELRDELMLLLWAGHDTTSNTLAWFAKYMTNYPKVQSRLRGELRRVFTGPELPSSSDIIKSDIPYLDGAIEESLRLAATTGRVSRVAKVDAEVLGHVIPAGTTIIMNGKMTQRPVPVAEELRSPSCRNAREKRPRGSIDGPAGDNLADFMPERWIVRENDGRDVFDAYTLPRLALGDGPRACFGRRLALQELRIMIVLVVLSMEFGPIPNSLNSMEGIEKLLRKPEQCYAQLKPL